MRPILLMIVAAHFADATWGGGDGILDGTELGLTAPGGGATDPSVFVPDSDPASLTNPLETDA